MSTDELNRVPVVMIMCPVKKITSLGLYSSPSVVKCSS